VRIDHTHIDGVVVLESEPIADERGSFARIFDDQLLADAGLPFTAVHVNLSHNRRRGTLRGMHYQAQPRPDPKIVLCTRGRLFDVAVDLRPDSPTHQEWFGLELAAGSGRALHVPAGCAHGFVTLEDDTDVLYLMGDYYEPDLARGVRWDDPAFGIEWPVEPVVISDRDATYPDRAHDA
jgi:dTDP-4-dehydrorhamnose 3,5-epimerase